MGVSEQEGVKKCTCRESNPGLIRGRDTSYHLTTSAHSYYHRDHLSWAQSSSASHQKQSSSVSGRHKGEEVQVSHLDVVSHQKVGT